jgi:hypothetical protein
MNISTSYDGKIYRCVRIEYVYGRDSNTNPHLVSNHSSICISATPVFL